MTRCKTRQPVEKLPKCHNGAVLKHHCAKLPGSATRVLDLCSVMVMSVITRNRLVLFRTLYGSDKCFGIGVNKLAVDFAFSLLPSTQLIHSCVIISC